MISKIVKREELVSQVESLKKKGKRIVFTNGCFDLLHLGHVRYLQEAKALGDCLIVGLNSDAGVKRLKGSPRPFLPEEERAEILASLECVDLVSIFPEDTPEVLLRLLKPDWYVKGGDYKLEELPETQWVAQYGGKIKTLAHVPGHSTSSLVHRISQAKKGESWISSERKET